MGDDHFGAFGFIINEVIYLGSGAVKHSDSEVVIVHIQHQVLAHYSQTNQTDIRFGLHFLLLQEYSLTILLQFNALETGTLYSLLNRS
jgi:hypothetical protein